jgi:nicotinamide riboside kinase
MAYKILIMGLSGAGKTTLAKPLIHELEKTSSVEWLNADIIRKKNNDWDFTPTGRLRQAQRIHDMSSKSTCDFVICDFIAPTVESRNIYSPDYTIWMDTIKSCKYTNTNELFMSPTEWNYRIVDYSDAAHINNIISDIQQRK